MPERITQLTSDEWGVIPEWLDLKPQRKPTFAIVSEVDPDARFCDFRIDVTPDGAVSPFSERHRQYFHRYADIRSALADSGFELLAVRDGYSDRPADKSTLSMTWLARLKREK